MNVQQPQMNLIQELNERHGKRLKETPYPSELTCTWRSAAVRMLDHHSLLTLGVSAADYAELVEALNIGSLTMMQFAILSNGLEAMTPNQIACGGPSEYASTMQEVSRLSVRWNEESDKIKAEVKQEVEMLLAATAPDRPAMQIVKGEA